MIQRITPDRAWPLLSAARTRALEQRSLATLPPHTLMGRAGLAAVNQALVDLKLPPLVASAFSPVNSDKVDGFTETGAGALNLQVSGQTNTSTKFLN